MLIVPQNIGAPTTITVRFKSPAISADLTTVTAIAFNVLRRDGTTTQFIASIISATTSELVAQYAFQGAGEITSTGAYYLQPSLSVPGGEIPAETVTMFVTSPYQGQQKVETEAWLLATSLVAGQPPRGAWQQYVAGDSPLVLSPQAPWVSLDLRGGPISATLWAPNDGDPIIIADTYAASGSSNFSLNSGDASRAIPSGLGTFAQSATYSTPGFTLRLKYYKQGGQWLLW
jgi:hypothetical protein